jgi:hypothetical protein
MQKNVFFVISLSRARLDNRLAVVAGMVEGLPVGEIEKYPPSNIKATEMNQLDSSLLANSYKIHIF